MPNSAGSSTASAISLLCISSVALITGLRGFPARALERWIIIALTSCAAVSSAVGLIRGKAMPGQDQNPSPPEKLRGTQATNAAGKSDGSASVRVEPQPMPSILVPIGGAGSATDSNKDWFSLVEECVELVKKLDSQQKGLDSARQEMVQYFVSQLQESLQRGGVQVITDEPIYDSVRHQVAPARPNVPTGSRIVETLSPGFAVGERILRRARVRLE
jgi:hypothetical protein